MRSTEKRHHSSTDLKNTRASHPPDWWPFALRTAMDPYADGEPRFLVSVVALSTAKTEEDAIYGVVWGIDDRDMSFHVYDRKTGVGRYVELDECGDDGWGD